MPAPICFPGAVTRLKRLFAGGSAGNEHLTAVSPGVARVTESAFRRVAEARGRRVFHPYGIAYHGEIVVGDGVPGACALAPGTRSPCVVRFSLGLGLPAQLGDVLGVAIRLEQEQDVLLATSASPPPGRFLPLPARSFFGRTYSSLLPFLVDDRRLLLSARVTGDAAPAADAWNELAEAAERAPLAIELSAAAPFGPWRPVASVATGGRLPDDETQALRFDAWRCEGGLVPWGWINRLREPAYRGSRRGRPDT